MTVKKLLLLVVLVVIFIGELVVIDIFSTDNAWSLCVYLEGTPDNCHPIPWWRQIEVCEDVGMCMVCAEDGSCGSDLRKDHTREECRSEIEKDYIVMTEFTPKDKKCKITGRL
jgi:hypothetical protein